MGLSKMKILTWLLFCLDVLTKNCTVGVHVGKSFTEAVGLKTFYAPYTTKALNLQDCLFQYVALPHCDIVEFQNDQCTMGQKIGYFNRESFNSSNAWEMSRPSGCIPHHCLEDRVKHYALAGVLVDSAYKCGCICVSTRGCTNFNWSKTDTKCYLKNYVNAPVVDSNMISGVLDC
ncbi:uncharacterized protein LOC111709157 isoform X2 [Eurytemora carolleeae]|uniref:uncharacterized protein LOC111709157 isoform X2 n=1 Tax=Eurytemora carolleeae TaxID=1294199 RepID=UPI000C760747|nr:uncharacterized protein LOC111709157 isoform X2 [Eurytemora carolleeae]|eukprot:XP_023338535.1 uncharacterized protein LOC111709157 isoform X2 [Eurytemora affinis]